MKKSLCTILDVIFLQVNLLPGALESSTNVSEYVLPEVTKIFV